MVVAIFPAILIVVIVESQVGNSANSSTNFNQLLNKDVILVILGSLTCLINVLTSGSLIISYGDGREPTPIEFTFN